MRITKLAILALLIFSCGTKPKYGVLILNGTIYDGTGGKPYQADIGISADRIVEIGKLDRKSSVEVIDATGMAVSPGFIDMHTHLEPIMELPMMESMLRQGVTFALGGPDGGGPWPFGEYLDSLESFPLGINVGYLTGHNSIREEVMGMDDRQPNPHELREMESMVSSAMDDGAFGISTGLKYLPGTFSDVGEVIALSQKAAEKGGIYTSHLREEGLGLLAAVREAVLISKEAEIPVVLTHHKAIGVKIWGASKLTLSIVDSARSQGLDILIDQYPYAASHTGISVLIPSWALEGNKFAERIQDPALKDSIKSGIIFNILNDRGGSDLRRIQFSKVE